MSGAVAPGSGYARAGADELIPVGTPALREPQQEQQQPQPQMDLPPQQHPLLRHTESAPEHGAGSSAVNGSGGKGLGNYQTFGGYSAAEQQEYGGVDHVPTVALLASESTVRSVTIGAGALI